MRLLLAALLLTVVARPARGEGERRPPPPAELALIEYAAGVGAAAITVPSTMAIGEAIGRSSGDLAAALVPGLLLMAIGPPFAVAGAEWLAGRLAGDRPRFHPAVWAGFAVNFVAIVLGSIGGVSADDPGRFTAFTISEMLLVPAAVTLVMHYKRPRPAPRAPLGRGILDGERPQGVPLPAAVLPVVKVTF